MLKLKNKASEIIILTTGRGKIPRTLKKHFDVKELGYIDNQQTLCNIYSAADILVISSIQDNLPNTVLESLACGTPVIGFETGGIPDMIQHMENGYLAKTKDTEDLAKGINTFLNDGELLKKSSRHALKTINEHFSEEIVAKQYLNLYSQQIDRF
jgi:glycosyltransferase involved in cell wall biosynthesis